jgi:hypothetical protein
MKRLVVFFVVLLAANAWLCSEDWQGVVRKFGPAVGKVEIRDGAVAISSGSCFLVDADGGILTNAHVVRDANTSGRRIVVTFPFLSTSSSPEEYEARIEAIDNEEDLDLAFLRIDSHFDVVCDLSRDAEPPLMSEILVMGFPLGKSFKSTPGFIQAYQDIEGRGHMLDLSASVDPGNSGGPVFGKDGKVVGIVTAKITGHNFNLALPIKNAIDFRGAGKERVSIVTRPEGARVFINGIYRGTSPLSVELMRRDSSLFVEKDGYATSESTITFKNGVKTDISIDLSPAVDPQAVVLHLASKPAGARVIIDNVEQGVAPLDVKTRKGSRLHIRLLLRGYKEFYADAVIGDSSEQTLEYTLKKAGLF